MQITIKLISFVAILFLAATYFANSKLTEQNTLKKVARDSLFAPSDVIKQDSVSKPPTLLDTLKTAYFSNSYGVNIGVHGSNIGVLHRNNYEAKEIASILCELDYISSMKIEEKRYKLRVTEDFEEIVDFINRRFDLDME